MRPDAPDAPLAAPDRVRGTALSACSLAAWDFSQAEEFWARFQPLTPYGKEEKEARLVLADRAAIEAKLDETEAWLAFESRRAGDPASLDRISWHLRRLPRLPDGLAAGASAAGGPAARGAGSPGPASSAAPGGRPDEPPLELVELFQIKKFLANWRGVFGLLDGELRGALRAVAAPESLSEELDKGGSDAESFYVAELYDEALPPLRRRLRELDAELAAVRGGAFAAALREDGLDFRGRDFLVLPRERARAAAARAETAASGCAEPGSGPGAIVYALEPYDSASLAVRIRPGAAELALETERDALLESEREAEGRAVARLSAMVRRAGAELAACAAAARRLDLARARARLAGEFRLTRPAFGPAGTGAAPIRGADESGAPAAGGAAGRPLLLARDARFLPCLWECERLGLSYSPLELELGEPAAVVFGSNMGGKTVSLKTLLFLQVLAQAGFHVPAARLETALYPRLHYVGELRGEHAPRGASSGGLSGFGFEIRALVEAWADAARGAFLVFDEFARTTGSAEAEAILSAAIGRLSRAPGCLSLFSTHFAGVARIPGVRYLRMRGLDRAAAAAALSADEPLVERIRRVNAMMTYALVPDAGERRESDAIAIARLLGLDEGIAAEAEALHRARHETSTTSSTENRA